MPNIAEKLKRRKMAEKRINSLAVRSTSMTLKKHLR